MKQVFFDDYRDLEVGIFPQDYSALGEYHFQLPQGKTGKWTATTVHHSWRGNPSWIINTESGKRVVEQACIREKFIPMLVAGQEWDDVVLKTTFRPLSLVGGFGIIFRYQTSRAYYALWFENETLELILCADEKRDVLARCPATFDCDTYFAVEIRTAGNKLTAQVGGYTLSAEDDTYKTGRVGFAATHPVRFGALEVLMDEAALYRQIAARQEANHKLEQKKATYPQLLLSKKILTPKYGVGKSIRFGDLNQDGRKEMLLAQNVRRMRGDNFSEISCLTAIDLDGKVLWQVGEPNPDNALVSNDLPVQIHDIDGDGKLEVIYCKDFMIRVLDGKTGQLKYEAPTPVAPPHKGPKMVETQYHRITGDSLYFCDLTNQGADRDLIIKDRYNNIWAYTWDLQLLWHYQGNCGHYPMACDIDGDGKDEILIGYTLLDHDGTVLWSLDIGDHADGVAIGKFNNGSEWQFIIAASDEGMYWVDQQGNVLQKQLVGHSQTVTIAPFIKGSSKLQVATVTFWGNPGIIMFFDANGNLLKRKEVLAPWGTGLSPVNWDGSGTELILLSANTKYGGLMDFDFDRVVTFPDDGHPDLCCEPVDLLGDGRDEILVWDEDSIWIYTQNRPSGGSYKPQRQKSYNMSNYRAQLSLSSNK